MKLPVKYDLIPRNEKRLVREEYIKVQNNLCYFCKAPLDGQPLEGIKDKTITPKLYPNGFFDHPVHLHHDHVTGLTLGAVHCYCNAVLWEYCGE